MKLALEKNGNQWNTNDIYIIREIIIFMKMNEKIMKERNEGIRIREGFSEALKQEQCRNIDPRAIALDLQYLLLQNEKNKFKGPNWLRSRLPLTASFLGSPSLVS